MLSNPQISDLVTFTEEILNGKLHFLCSAITEFSGAIKEKGQKFTLKMMKEADLRRLVITVNIFSNF